MKKFAAISVVLALTAVSQAQTLIDGWYYTVPDGTFIDGPGTSSVSTNHPDWAWEATWKSKGIAGSDNIVSNEAQRWEGSYVAGTITTNDGIFKSIVPFSSANAVGGIYEWSYDITSADFANTAANDGSANAMYVIRGKSEDSNYDCGLRIRYEGGLDVTNVFAVNGTPISTNIYADADQVQILMKSLDLGGWTVLTNFPGSAVSDLHLSMLYDLSMKTNAAYLTAGAGSEILLHSGTMQADWNLAEMRQGFQSGNGGNSWRPGDVLMIDNIELYQIEDAPPPEATIVDLWTFDGLADGSSLSSAVSSGLVGGVTFGDKVEASITNEMLQLTPTPTSAGLYNAKNPSLFDGAESGVFAISYDIPYMDFTNTDAADGSANFGFEVRDRTSPTANNGLMSATVLYDGAANQFTLQMRDATGIVGLRSFPGPVLSNLSVRVVFDLDDAGNPGSAYSFYTYEGVEVAATYNGTLAADYSIDEVRLRAAFSGTWQLGDVAMMDNIMFEKVAAMPAQPVYAEKVFYDMNDPDGTLLNELAQTGTDGGQLQGTDPNIVADGLGSLVYGGDGTNDVTRKHFLDIAYTSGLHRLEFAFDDWSLAASEDSSMLKFGLTDDTGTNTVQFGIDVNTNNATVRFRAAANGGDAAQDFYDYPGYVASTGVVLRIDVNLDGGLYGASWRYATSGQFTSVIDGGSLGELGNIAEIRLNANAGATTGFDPNDYVSVDYLVYSTTSGESLPTPEQFYALWLDGYPALGGATNLTDNSDGDPFVNLWEYAFDGDPTVAEPIPYAPAVHGVVKENGTNYLDYVYTRRKQPDSRGLSYYTQLTTDLVTGTWTNDTSRYVVIGENVDADWWAVTNRIDMTQEDQLFIRSGVSVDFAP